MSNTKVKTNSSIHLQKLMDQAREKYEENKEKKETKPKKNEDAKTSKLSSTQTKPTKQTPAPEKKKKRPSESDWTETLPKEYLIKKLKTHVKGGKDDEDDDDSESESEDSDVDFEVSDEKVKSEKVDEITLSELRKAAEDRIEFKKQINYPKLHMDKLIATWVSPEELEKAGMQRPKVDEMFLRKGPERRAKKTDKYELISSDSEDDSDFVVGEGEDDDDEEDDEAENEDDEDDDEAENEDEQEADDDNDEDEEEEEEEEETKHHTKKNK